MNIIFCVCPSQPCRTAAHLCVCLWRFKECLATQHACICHPNEGLCRAPVHTPMPLEAAVSWVIAEVTCQMRDRAAKEAAQRETLHALLRWLALRTLPVWHPHFLFY